VIPAEKPFTSLRTEQWNQGVDKARAYSPFTKGLWDQARTDYGEVVGARLGLAPNEASPPEVDQPNLSIVPYSEIETKKQEHTKQVFTGVDVDLTIPSSTIGGADIGAGIGFKTSIKESEYSLRLRIGSTIKLADNLTLGATTTAEWSAVDERDRDIITGKVKSTVDWNLTLNMPRVTNLNKPGDTSIGIGASKGAEISKDPPKWVGKIGVQSQVSVIPKRFSLTISIETEFLGRGLDVDETANKFGVGIIGFF